MKSFEKRWPGAARATISGLAILLTICFAFSFSFANPAKGKKASGSISITLGAAADFAVRSIGNSPFGVFAGTVNNHSGAAASAPIIVEERS